MKKSILAISIIFIFQGQVFGQEESGFSQELLEQLGIDPSIIEKIDSGNVLTGKTLLPVYVNGTKVDNLELDFVEGNDFYVDKDFIDRIGLIDELTDKRETFKEIYTEASVEYKNEVINIYIPNSYFKPDPSPKQKGRGGFVNYNLDYDKELSNEEGDSAEDIFSANVDYGLNFDGYLYRAGFSYDNFNDDFNFSYNYLQKNFFSRKTLGRIGDVFTLNPLHNGVDVLGVQYTSDSNFLSSSVARVEGNVSTQTRVEIYINQDILIYQDTVSPGYYEFDDVVLPFSATTLRVVERGVDGAFNEREVLVQQTGFTLGDEVEFAITAGIANEYVVNNENEDDDFDLESSEYNDWVVSGYSDLYKTENDRLQGSFLIGKDYYFGASSYTQTNLNFYKLSSYTFDAGFSYDNTEDDLGEGFFVSTSANFILEQESGLNIFGRYETEEFRNIDTNPSDLEAQYSLSAYSKIPFFDSGSLSYNRSFFYDDSPIASVNLSLQKFYEDESYFNIEAFYDSEDEWNVNFFVSIPINDTKYIDFVDFGYLRDRTEEQLDAAISGNIKDYEYNARYSYFVEEESSTASINVSKDYKDTYVSTGVFITEDGFDNGFVSLEGGFAFSTEGYYDFTSETIDDTFAFIEIGDLDDVEVETFGANVYTDEGVAVIPSVDPFRDNTVTIVTRTLPENVTVDNGIRQINLPFASIGKIVVPTKPFYASLIRLVDKDNVPLDTNYVITTMDDIFVTTVGFDGLVFFEVETSDTKFKATKTGKECLFDLSKIKETEDNTNIGVVLCN